MARKDLVDQARRVATRGERVGIDEMLRLIHAVNPTGAGLSKNEARDRYALKSTLQSRLVDWHGDALRVRTTADPEIVAIDCASGTADAAHARVADLDDEAQLWVRRRLVEQELVDDAPERPAWSVPRPQGLVERGIALLKAYQTEDGEALLREAMATDEGPAATLALLEYLVDEAARDEDALGLAIPADVRDSAPIRHLLAAAALGAKRPGLALRYVDGMGGRRAAELVRKAAAQLLDAGDDNAAQRALLRASDLEPVHTELAALTKRLQAQRAAGWQPLVGVFDGALKAGDLDAATAAIDDVQARAGVVGWVLEARAEVARRRERLRATALVATAETVPPERAVVLLREARALGIDGLDDRIAAIETELAQRKDAREVRRIVGLLAEGDATAGLVAWSALSDALRAEVRARCEHPWFGNLAAGLAVASGDDVVLAIARLDAVEGLAQEELLAALTGIAGLPAVERRRAEARAAIAATDVIADRARLKRATDALDRGDATTCRRVLAEVSSRAETRASVAALRDRLGVHERVVGREQRWTELAAEPLPFEARRFASEIAAEPGAAAHCAVRARAADERLTALFQVRPLEASDLRVRSGGWKRESMPPWAMTADGPIVLVDTVHWSVFIALVDPTTAEPLRGWHVHVPAPIALPKYGLDGDLLWLLCEDSAFLLAIDLTSGRIESWMDLTVVGGAAQNAFVHQGILWAHVGTPEAKVASDEPVHLVDIRRRTRLHVDTPVILATLIPGSPPRIAGLRPASGRFNVVWLDSRGAILSFAGPVDRAPTAALPDPIDPEGLVIPVRDADMDPTRKDSHVMQLLRLRDGAARPSKIRAVARGWNVSTSSESGLVVGQFLLENGTETLVGYRADATDNRAVWTVANPPEGQFVGTRDGATVWYLSRRPETAEFEFQRLGNDPPRFVHAERWTPPRPNALAAMVMDLKSPPSRHRKRNADGDIEDPPVPADPEWGDVGELAWWTGRTLHSEPTRGEPMLEQARERWPRDGRLALLAVQVAFKNWEWKKIEPIFATADLGDLPPEIADHVRHVVGAGRLFCGDRDGAYTIWDEVKHKNARTGVDEDRTIADAIGPGAAPTDAALVAAATVVQACRRSDGALRSGDLAAAFAILDVPAVWNAREVQSIARRAAIAANWTDGPWARRRRAVDALRMVFRMRTDRSMSHVPVDDAWEGQRIADTLDAGILWVDAMDLRIYVPHRASTQNQFGPTPRPAPILVPAPAPPGAAVSDPVPGLIAAGAAVADLVAAGATVAELRPIRDAIARQRPPIVDRVPRGRRLVADEPVWALMPDATPATGSKANDG